MREAQDPFQPEKAMIGRHPLSRFVRRDEYPVCPQALRDMATAEDALIAEAERLMTAPRQTFVDYIRHVTDALASGKPLPEDFTRIAADTVSQQEKADLKLMAVRSAQEAISSRWPKVAREHADEMLLGLRAELDELLAETRATARTLGSLDPTDSEAVAAATPDQHAALLRLKELRPRYRQLRTLQQQLVEAIQPRPWNREDGYDVSNYSWRRFWETRVHEFSEIPKQGAPHTDSRSVLWYRALLHRDDVWLPTMPELRAAWEQIRHKVPVN